jgi:hypothetical protein
MDEITLRQRARQALESGMLPARRPDRLWGGPGHGEVCILCRERVSREDTAFDLEFIGPTGVLVNRSLHFRCFAAWEHERESVAAGEEAGPLPDAPEGGTIPHRELDVRRKNGLL